MAWYDENSNDETHGVGQKKGNGYGLYDMSGNVWEWVWDTAVIDIDHEFTGESVYTKAAKTDPYIDKPSPRRVLRGGAFSDIERALCVSYRGNIKASDRCFSRGFRFLRTIL